MISMSASSDALVAEGSLREKRNADPAMALVLRKLRRCMLVLNNCAFRKTFTQKDESRISLPWLSSLHLLFSADGVC
jgi:hypothetical protein